jgi:structural maintenance of chromosomes protein 5
VRLRSVDFEQSPGHLLFATILLKEALDPWMPHFKDGSIKTLKLQNFQTYGSAQFNFCPTLNFIAGPNGSGKSTIANAIALVFGGTPKTIGKGRDVGDYVKFGEIQGHIEATVLFKGKDVVLERVIKKTNQSIYHIDGAQCTKGNYESFLLRMGMRVENLCQFLPQEKVSEFSRLLPEDLLIETLLAVGEEEAVEGMDGLKQLEKQAHGVDERVEHFLKQREGMENVLANISVNVKKIEEKEGKEHRLALLREKKEWLVYAGLKTEYVRVKKAAKKCEKEIEEQLAAMGEAEKEIERLRSEGPSLDMNRVEEKLEKHNVTFLILNEDMGKARHNLDLLDTDFKSLNSRRDRRMEAAERIGAEIEGFEEEYSKLCIPSEPLAFDGSRVAKAEERMQDLARAKSAIQYECSEIKRRMEDLQNRKRRLGEVSQRKLEQLKKYHFDTYQAVLWLRNNTHRFEDEIIEPPILQICMRNVEYSLEVESFLGFQSLTPFICKSSRDFEAFMQIVKDEKKWGINAVEAVEAGDREVNLSQTRKIVKEYGFDAVLIDLIDARREVLEYLAAVGHFDAIPITKGSVNETEVFNSTDIKRMAANGRYIEVKRSRYGKDYVIIDNPLKSRSLFSQSFSQDEIESIERELGKQDQIRKRKGEELKKVLEQMEGLDEEVRTLCRARNEHNKKAAEVGRIKSRVKILESSLEQRRKEKMKLLDFEDLKAEESRMRKKKEEAKAAWKATLKAVEDFLSSQDYFEVLKEGSRLSRELRNITKNIELLEEQRAAAELKHASAILSLTQHRQQQEETKKRIGEKRKMLEKIAKSEEYTRAMSQLPEDLHELENEIFKEDAQLYLMNVDTKAREAYLAQEESLNALVKILGENLAAKKSIDAEITHKRSNLFGKIRKVVGPVNEAFGGLFKRFSCEGKVLFVGEDMPASKWRLNVLVRFRTGEDLEVLNSYRQSGGEKSVSTILFLLAIQAFRPSPFRLVDEINQGMDRHNEKLVHNILVDMSEERDATQFFIITPKIVPDLTYSSMMKIIILYTGDGSLTSEVFVRYKLRALMI